MKATTKKPPTLGREIIRVEPFDTNFEKWGEVIEEGVPKTVSAMEWLETIYVDGVKLEAFTTSGGLGTMCETYAGGIEARIRACNIEPCLGQEFGREVADLSKAKNNDPRETHRQSDRDRSTRGPYRFLRWRYW